MNADSISSDKPLSRGSDKQQDFLRRRPLAERIARLINGLNDKYEDSIVIGIEGEWGAGKTSLINFILGLVDPEDTEPEKPANSNTRNEAVEQSVVVEFNPWNFSDQDELIKDLFTSITRKLEQCVDEDEDKSLVERLTKNIAKYASKLRPNKVKLNPSVSVGGIGTSLIEAEWKLDDGDDLGETLQKQRDEIEEDLRELKRRIVILIDDIDRLDSEETKLIFKLVKLTANFPYTVFLLAYDRAKVGERLTENEIDGEEYLKKVIQLPFLIPNPPVEYLREELINAIEEEIKAAGFGEYEGEKEARWYKLIKSREFKEFFPTVRDIRRYINSLRLDLKMLDNVEIEVDPVDFVGVEIIRVFAPEMYVEMTYHGQNFTKIESDDDKDKESKEERKNALEVMLNMAPPKLKNSIEMLIFRLFPQVEALYAGTDLENREHIWEVERKVCSKDVFEQYFYLSIPPTMLPEKVVADFLSITGDRAVLVKELERLHGEKQLTLLIKKLIGRIGSRREDEYSQRKRKNLIVGISEFVQSIKKEDGEFHEIIKNTDELIFQTLMGIKENKRLTFLISVIEATGVSLIMTKSIVALGRIRKENAIMNEVDISEVTGNYLDKIKEAARDNSLVKRKGSFSALKYWSIQGERRAAEDYFAELMESKDALLSILWDSKGVTVHTFTGEFRRNYIDRKNAAEFTSIGKLDKRIDEIKREGNLTEKDANTIAMYETSENE